MLLKAFLILQLFIFPALAKDLGTHGPVFSINEPSLLEMINTRLAKLKEEGKIEALQKDLQRRAAQKIEKPLPVEGITKVRKGRSKIYDPTFIASQDIKDAGGNFIIKAGTSFNPLDKMSFGDPLLFIDGDDEGQVQWSLSQKGKIILIKGAPLALSRVHNRSFYFDQGAVLTQKLGITEVPSLVSQEGRHLVIETIPLTSASLKGEGQ